MTTTTIERFQNLQVELVGVGLPTEFVTRPEGGDKAKLTMFVDLKGQTTARVEQLDQLASTFGFSYTVQDDSRAALALADDVHER
jgi:hypothetical protein